MVLLELEDDFGGFTGFGDVISVVFLIWKGCFGGFAGFGG